MALLAGTNYDPGTLATKATTAGTVMTAFDTTNLRLNFTVPANGSVLVRIRGAIEGGASAGPYLLFGVLEGATVRGRVSAIGTLVGQGAATTRLGYEALFVVPGLTPAAALTWDAAYGVEASIASSSLRYGGPNDTTTDNANGGLSFEIYDCPSLLAAALYDPSSAATKATSALLAMTALDTTNLRLTFTAPASGNVLVRMCCAIVVASTTYPQILLGVLDGATVRGRAQGAGNIAGLATLAAPLVQDATFVVTGLTPTTSYTWDAAYSVDVLVTTTNLRYGGPNDTSTGTAWGAFQYEIWGV